MKYHLCQENMAEPNNAELVVIPDAEWLANGQDKKDCKQEANNSSQRSHYSRSHHPTVTSPFACMSWISEPVDRAIANKVDRHDD